MNEIVKFQEIATSAPQILQESQGRVTKAVSFGESLLAKVEQEGMNDSLDEDLNNFQVKAKKTLDLILSKRKPITQMMDSFKKEFTSTEAKLDPKKSDSIYFKIQQKRNNWAQYKLEEQKKREQEALRKQAIQKEKAEVFVQIETALENYFNDYISDYIDQLYKYFNAATLENLAETEKTIKKAVDTYPEEHFNQFKVGITTIYLTKDDKVALKVDVMDGKYGEFKRRYAERVKEAKIDIVSKIPSKKAELEQLAKANAEEVKRLKSEQEKRQQEEAELRAKEKKEAEEKAKAEAEAKQKAAEMQSMFDAEVKEKVTRSGYEINVKHPAGFVLLFQFWFEKEGKNLALDQLARKNLGQMKSFCEKYAHKNEEVIKSPYLEYKEIAKVAARK